MAFQKRPGTGSLWVNDRKTQDSHPDRTGTLVLPDGTECFIDGWLKETPDGKKFLSLSVKPKRQQGAPAARKEQPERQPIRKLAPPPSTSEPDTEEYEPGDKNAPDADPNF